LLIISFCFNGITVQTDFKLDLIWT